MRRPRRWRSVAAAVAAALALGAWAAALLPAPAPRGERGPARIRGFGPEGVAFLPSEACAECHPQQHRDWSGSHHQRAMQRADPRSVLGDFDGALFTRFGIETRFFRKGERFFVRTEGADGEMADFEVAYTLGVEPLQQYLVAFPGGRLQCLTVAWDTGRRRWYSLYPEERIGPEHPLHWTGRYQNWNSMCAECHTTNLRVNYDAGEDAYRTEWDQMNVGCDACHGPGARHVAWARERARGGAPTGDGVGLLVEIGVDRSRAQVDLCARCHARRRRVGLESGYGRPLLDEFVPELLREGLYHADGQILDEVYVYGSFVQSRMYRAGVACTDCHEPHALGLREPGDALCLRCHREQPSPRFGALRARRYDTREHHFHPEGSAAARCVACHMPARIYMGVDARHDHSFRIPRPDLSVTLGTPNACNGCHLDRTPEWALRAVERWYRPKSPRAPHFAEVIAAGRIGAAGAEQGLVALAADTGQPALVRATALDLLRGSGAAGAAALRAATRDEAPLVRATAAGSLDPLPPRRRLESLAPLLTDPVRAVRIEAARALTSVPSGWLSPAQRAAFETALAEYEELQLATAHHPGARFNLGVVQMNLGRLESAEASYRSALRIDGGFLPAYANLAHLYNRTGRNRDAERVLRQALERLPDEGELHFSLGLLLGEESRLEQARVHLARAAELLPERARVHYNHGLVLQHLGRAEEAEAPLLEAHRLSPEAPSILRALAVFYAQRGERRRALAYAERLAGAQPEDAAARRLLQEIRAGTAPR